jgi:hypothetical protein
MGMAVVMDGAIAADAGIITDGAEVVATTMVGDIIAITGDFNLKPPPLAASLMSGRTSMTHVNQENRNANLNSRPLTEIVVRCGFFGSN